MHRSRYLSIRISRRVNCCFVDNSACRCKELDTINTLLHNAAVSCRGTLGCTSNVFPDRRAISLRVSFENIACISPGNVEYFQQRICQRKGLLRPTPESTFLGNSETDPEGRSGRANKRNTAARNKCVNTSRGGARV